MRCMCAAFLLSVGLFLQVACAQYSWSVAFDTQFAPQYISTIEDMIVFKDQLFIVGWRKHASYRFDGTTWHPIGTLGFLGDLDLSRFPNGYPDIDPGTSAEMAIHNDELYMVFGSAAHEGISALYKYNEVAEKWDIFTPGPPFTPTSEVPANGDGAVAHYLTAIASYNGKLYVGSNKRSTDPEGSYWPAAGLPRTAAATVFAWDGVSWAEVFSDPNPSNAVAQLDNKVAYWGRFTVHDFGSGPKLIMSSYEHQAFHGTLAWEFDGTTWSYLGKTGWKDVDSTGLVGYKEHAFFFSEYDVGSLTYYDGVPPSPPPVGNVYLPMIQKNFRDDCAQPGSGDVEAGSAWQGDLYVMGGDGGAACSIWRLYKFTGGDPFPVGNWTEVLQLDFTGEAWPAWAMNQMVTYRDKLYVAYQISRWDAGASAGARIIEISGPAWDRNDSGICSICP